METAGSKTPLCLPKGQSTAVMTPTLPDTRTPSACPGLCPASPPRPPRGLCSPLSVCGRAAGTRRAQLGDRRGTGPGVARAQGRGSARPGPPARCSPGAGAQPPGRGARPPPPGPDGHLRWGPVPPGAPPAAGRTPARLRQGCGREGGASRSVSAG